MNLIEGNFQGEGLKIHLVVGRFNEFIASKLLDGCIDGLTRHGVREQDISVCRVPGSFEIPLVAQKIAREKKPDAVICLGAVIRGSTDHYAYIAGEMAKGIARAGQQSGLPVIFGVITCDTIEQAIERAGGKRGNKGFDAALNALEMATLMKKLA